MAIIKKTLLVITLLITVCISQSCEKDPLDLYQQSLAEMVEKMTLYGYHLDVIQMYEEIKTSEKKVEIKIDNINDRMYVYMYEVIIARFNEEMKPFEKTYFYEEQTIYEDFNDVMTSRSGHKDELIEMASLEILKNIFDQITSYDIHSEGIRLYLKDLRDVDIIMRDTIITEIKITTVLKLTTITHTFYPFYENGQVFIPKYKLEGTPA
jgi:hypothetical protein